MKLTLHKSQIHRYGVMQWWACSSLMYPPLPADRGWLRKSRADCSTVGLYCVIITGQQILKSSLYITVAGVLLHETVERTHRGR